MSAEHPAATTHPAFQEDLLATQLQETGRARVEGFSLTAINQLVALVGLTTSEVVVSDGYVEVIRLPARVPK